MRACLRIVDHRDLTGIAIEAAPAIMSVGAVSTVVAIGHSNSTGAASPASATSAARTSVGGNRHRTAVGIDEEPLLLMMGSGDGNFKHGVVAGPERNTDEDGRTIVAVLAVAAG